MRTSLPAILFALLLGTPVLIAPAMAAPTCQDRNGDTIRCADPNAMPVGWTASPEVLWDRQLSRPPGPPASEVLEAILGIGLLLALFALLPQFDGSRPEDWDRQEDDTPR